MIVGIDLGTTHSLVGVFEEGGPRLLPNALGKVLTPSAVSIADDGTVLVGAAAKDRLVSHPDRSISGFKRWMGTSRTITLGTHRFRPEELSALVLRSLLADAEHALGARIEEAVISVPAYFGDGQRSATKTAGQLAGIRVDRLISEPTAAALAYGLQSQGEGRFVVIDLGGGTFDVSILELWEGVVEVRATAGDNFLGGDDFTTLLSSMFLRSHGLDGKRLTPEESALLRRRLDVLKHELATREHASLSVRVGGEERQWSVAGGAFDAECEPLLARLREPIERAMRDTKLAAAEVDEVILVGGASRMPAVARLSARMFGRMPLRHVAPDEAIALGACVAAGMKVRNVALQETVLTDVCPHTLGISISDSVLGRERIDGLFSPIIPRNTTVPVSRVRTYFPAEDHQARLSIEAYEGESPRVENNELLGEIVVPLPRLRSLECAVDVRFTYDINGILEVEVTVVPTGAIHREVLQRGANTIPADEIAGRLRALEGLKIHPRERQENAALLARGERLYAEHLVARDDVMKALVAFEAVLRRQDDLEIRDARRLLEKWMAEIEAGGVE